MPTVSLKGEGRVISVDKLRDTFAEETQEGTEPGKLSLCRERPAGRCEQNMGSHTSPVKGQV